MTEAHPLFPVEHDDDEPAEVGWIHVTRFEGGGQKWSPRLFAASELADLETLAEAFGGGSFELVARGHDRRTITGRRRYQLPGRPLPLDGGASEERMPAATQAPAPSSTSDAILIAMMQMMAQQQQAQTQLMVAMLTKSDQSSKEHVQSMTALHDRFAQSQAMLFGKMLEAQQGGGAGGGGMDGFMKGIEFAQEMVQGQAEAQADKDDSGSDLKELLEGVKMFASMQHQERLAQMEAMRAARQGQRPPPPPKPAQGPPPNGAAES
ncbi:MAG: hypothetical protein IPM35_17095 [Myxococcales bacterium]|nr:hypothetical protein [Myxococcales bacterium]